jgi:prepilin-type N-terminal cleavage/methylation domain-containing protein
MTNRRAFTLIELLVVIAIVAILAATLLPALNRAREAARLSKCLSNMKQTTLGMTMYLNDGQGYFPGEVASERQNELRNQWNGGFFPYEGAVNNYDGWRTDLIPYYMGGPKVHLRAFDPDRDIAGRADVQAWHRSGVMACPNAAKMQGLAVTGTHPITEAVYGTFALSAWVAYRNYFDPWSAGSSERPLQSDRDIRHPSEFGLIWEGGTYCINAAGSNWHSVMFGTGRMPMGRWIAPSSYQAQLHGGTDVVPMGGRGRFYFSNGRGTVGYMDGHAKAINVTELGAINVRQIGSTPWNRLWYGY